MFMNNTFVGWVQVKKKVEETMRNRIINGHQLVFTDMLVNATGDTEVITCEFVEGTGGSKLTVHVDGVWLGNRSYDHLGLENRPSVVAGGYLSILMKHGYFFKHLTEEAKVGEDPMAEFSNLVDTIRDKIYTEDKPVVLRLGFMTLTVYKTWFQFNDLSLVENSYNKINFEEGRDIFYFIISSVLLNTWIKKFGSYSWVYNYDNFRILIEMLKLSLLPPETDFKSLPNIYLAFNMHNVVKECQFINNIDFLPFTVSSLRFIDGEWYTTVLETKRHTVEWKVYVGDYEEDCGSYDFMNMDKKERTIAIRDIVKKHKSFLPKSHVPSKLVKKD